MSAASPKFITGQGGGGKSSHFDREKDDLQYLTEIGNKASLPII